MTAATVDGSLSGRTEGGRTDASATTPQVAIAATVVVVIACVVTPRVAVWAFVAYALLIVGWAVILGVPAGAIARRLRWELPFVVFAVVIPFVAAGPRIAVGPLDVSEPGLWAAWNIVAKATIGVAAAALLGARLDQAQLVAGMARLRIPGVLVQVAAFMARYTELVAAEWGRMRSAQAARGFRARNVRAWPAMARALGALFVRTYERGERVHRAMLARGYDGSALPWEAAAVAATGAAWVKGMVPAACACAIAVAALAVA